VGQKTHPVGLRLGIIKGWDSNWYGGNHYADKIVEDQKIRNYLTARLPKGGISRIVIERTLKRLILTIHTARPGIVIGKGGAEVEKLKEEVKELTAKSDVQINIFEIKRPEIDARLVAENIGQQLRARISFRRAMKASVASAMRMGAEGIKVRCSGRLGGAEIARTEQYKEGRVPLQTLRADIDYAEYAAHTIYGAIGIKVWVCRGEVYGKPDLSPNAVTVTQTSARQPMGGFDRNDRNDRRGGGDRGGNRGGGQGGDRGGNRGPGGQGGGGNAGGGPRPSGGGGRPAAAGDRPRRDRVQRPAGK
jgi:small subunit ribosomal protein S3